jgi:hypothetical protein
MRKLLYIFLILTIGITGLVLSFETAQAQPVIVSGGSTEIQNPLEHDTFDALVKAIIGFVFKIALVIAPLMIIVAGFLFLTSAGDPKKIETAKAVLMYTLIGLGICLMATGIIKLINQVLGFGG